MAIKYISIPERRKTVAILEGTSWDALNKITKLCGNASISPDLFYYEMPDHFRAVAVCSAEDEWDEEVGKKIAKEKLMRKYYNSFDGKIDLFRKNVAFVNAMLSENK